MKRFFQALLLSVSFFAAPALLAEVVNINKATAAALQENLKGIGGKKALAIVTYRKEYGAFKTLDEIMEVKGIGKGIFKKIKADIALDKGITDLVGEKKAEIKAVKPAKKTTVKKVKTIQKDIKVKQGAKAKQDEATKALIVDKKSG